MSARPACSTSSPPEKRSTNSAAKLTRCPMGGYHITPLPPSVPEIVRRVLTTSPSNAGPLGMRLLSWRAP